LEVALEREGPDVDEVCRSFMADLRQLFPQMFTPEATARVQRNQNRMRGIVLRAR
jgi:hypothetical protein